MQKEMLQPNDWFGPSRLVPDSHFDWLRQLPTNTYCLLWQSIPNTDLPEGYDLYIVSFRECIAIDWLKRQGRLAKAPIVLLHNENNYNVIIENVHFYNYYVWHYQVNTILDWNPDPTPKNIKYKASAFCNRITQSKLLIFTKLAEELGLVNCLLKLGTWLEEKNVHNKERTGFDPIDEVSDIFWRKYFGTEYKFDDWNPEDNFQRCTANTSNIAYTEAAVNFTNESFHYSLMQEEDKEEYIWPGPFLTEKTLICLAAGTAFVPVGQFDTYGTLSKLGLRFDYGFDTSWDKDPGNLTRMVGIFNLIKSFKGYTANELYQLTADSSQYNLDMIKAGVFYKQCEQVNQSTRAEIIDKFK
jgi:hypothetical protein